MPRAPSVSSIQAEIDRLVNLHGYDKAILIQFASFVKGKKLQLTLPELKKAVYRHFQVSSTPKLKASGSFQMATDGMNLSLSQKESWKKIYRRWIGVLPDEDGVTGDNCINGINIFDYDLPWRVFGLDRHTATDNDIKAAYRELSKTYHPDQPTGNPDIFNRLNVFYRSLLGKG
ncbi:J domain-containing protein [Candidatus Synechococcus calcipolaris G9]|uniref:J domain-containing protein n=1 Tax=Candidatus Synechococcus calcipolaris G9 TaxID=1497997 RepID=A0ABT6EYK3_9SYNE|nr:J domain-containing protein [Candidatus Synechococcus calcipolaris]MDG2990879.1 J domain-containing protein [Candidatus Synechococcus calcipolaris G9]